MNRRQAIAAIKGILDAVDDKALPKGRIRVEEHPTRGTETLLWFDNLSCGYYLGSAKNGFGQRIPEMYHREAAEKALVLEAVYRADKRHRDAEATEAAS